MNSFLDALQTEARWFMRVRHIGRYIQVPRHHIPTRIITHLAISSSLLYRTF